MKVRKQKWTTKSLERFLAMNEQSGDMLDFSGHDFSGLDLSGLRLRDMCFEKANFHSAVIDMNDFTYSELTGADFSKATIFASPVAYEYAFGGAILTGVRFLHKYSESYSGFLYDDLPVVDRLHSKIRDAVMENPKSLNMNIWHSAFGTAHCRAGWAVTLAAETSELVKQIELLFKTGFTAALLYHRAYPDQPTPNFHTTTEDAMESIIRDADAENNL